MATKSFFFFPLKDLAATRFFIVLFYFIQRLETWGPPSFFFFFWLVFFPFGDMATTKSFRGYLVATNFYFFHLRPCNHYVKKKFIWRPSDQVILKPLGGRHVFFYLKT
jgi:hypothetical protein